MQAKKGKMQAKGASPKRAMFSRLGGLASPCGYLSLSLSLFFRTIFLDQGFPSLYLAWVAFLGYGNILFIFPIPCLAIPFGCRQCLFYHLCTLLGLCSLGMTMSDLLFLYLVGPYPWDVGNDWFIFFFCVLALCMLDIYIYIYIYIYIHIHTHIDACLKMVMYFV